MERMERTPLGYAHNTVLPSTWEVAAVGLTSLPRLGRRARTHDAWETVLKKLLLFAGGFAAAFVVVLMILAVTGG